MKEVVPQDTRYIPLTQQQYCCVPTCIQMIMLKHSIPLKPSEEIGRHLGLVVSPKSAGLFYNPTIAKDMPKAGYGTQVGKKIQS